MHSPRRRQEKTAHSKPIRLISAKVGTNGNRLPDEDLHRDMVAFGKKLSKDPAAARDFLRRAGIVKSDGTLAKAYGG